MAKDAKVVIDGNKEGKVADLIPGTVVSANLSAYNEIIGVIRADGPAFHGTVKAVDAGKNTITLTIPTKSGGEDRTFSMPKDTKVVTSFSGAPTALAEVKTGKQVLLRLSTNQKTTARITLLFQ